MPRPTLTEPTDPSARPLARSQEALAPTAAATVVVTGQAAETTLDLLAPLQRATIVRIDWSALAPEEAKRLQAMGIDEGADVSVAHRGIFWTRDPLALTVGRMTVAVRRAHARAMTVSAV